MKLLGLGALSMPLLADTTPEVPLKSGFGASCAFRGAVLSNQCLETPQFLLVLSVFRFGIQVSPLLWVWSSKLLGRVEHPGSKDGS